MRRLVKGHGEDDRQHPGAGLVDRRGHATAPFIARACAISASKRRSASAPIELARAVRRIASPRASRAAASRRQRRRPRRRSPPSRPGRRCNGGPDRSRRRAPAAPRSPRLPPSARIDKSSETSTPSKPISPRIDLADHRAATTSPARPGRSRDRRYARSSPRASRRARGTARNRCATARLAVVDDRAGVMAVDAGAAVAGNVLDDRQHAAGEQPLAHRPAETRDPVAARRHRRGRRSPDRRRRPAGRAPARNRR